MKLNVFDKPNDQSQACLILTLFLTATLAAAALLLACGKEKESPQSPSPQDDPSLRREKWQLQHFVDNITGHVDIPHNEDWLRQPNYWIQLHADGTVSGFGAVNTLHGTYTKNEEGSMTFSIHETTEVNDPWGDERRMVTALNDVQRYECTEGAMRLFYNNEIQYMDFINITEL